MNDEARTRLRRQLLKSCGKAMPTDEAGVIAWAGNPECHTITTSDMLWFIQHNEEIQGCRRSNPFDTFQAIMRDIVPPGHSYGVEDWKILAATPGPGNWFVEEAEATT